MRRFFCLVIVLALAAFWMTALAAPPAPGDDADPRALESWADAIDDDMEALARQLAALQQAVNSYALLSCELMPDPECDYPGQEFRVCWVNEFGYCQCSVFTC